MNMLKRELDRAIRSCSESRPRGLRLGTVLLCGILLGGGPVLAQPMGRTLTGTVTDRHHEPLSGAIVQVHSETTLSVVSYITDRGGQYVFKHLSTDDDYDVFATFRGVRSKARRLSKFDSKADRQVRLVIKLP
jgi:hypothetical protein